MCYAANLNRAGSWSHFTHPHWHPVSVKIPTDLAKIPSQAWVAVAGPGSRWLRCRSAFCPRPQPLPDRDTITSGDTIWIQSRGRTALSLEPGGKPRWQQGIGIALARLSTFPNMKLLVTKFPVPPSMLLGVTFPPAQWVAAALVWFGFFSPASRLQYLCICCWFSAGCLLTALNPAPLADPLYCP